MRELSPNRLVCFSGKAFHRTRAIYSSTPPGGKAMFQMLGVFAEFERSIIQERVRAGLRRAVSEGKKLGRPRIAADIEARILAALRARKDTGDSVRRIAARFGIDPSTVQRISGPFHASAAA
jgi:DNA invertase Pin-like site-specific DNA recombinase